MSRRVAILVEKDCPQEEISINEIDFYPEVRSNGMHGCVTVSGEIYEVRLMWEDLWDAGF